jgi:hypothetical protein
MPRQDCLSQLQMHSLRPCNLLALPLDQFFLADRPHLSIGKVADRHRHGRRLTAWGSLLSLVLIASNVFRRNHRQGRRRTHGLAASLNSWRNPQQSLGANRLRPCVRSTYGAHFGVCPAVRSSWPVERNARNFAVRCVDLFCMILDHGANHSSCILPSRIEMAATMLLNAETSRCLCANCAAQNSRLLSASKKVGVHIAFNVLCILDKTCFAALYAT